MAPVTLSVCPVNQGAPDFVTRSRPRSSAILVMVCPVAFLVAGSPVVAGNNREELEEACVVAQETWSLRRWYGHNREEVDEQVQQRDLVVPRPVGSTLLVGNSKCAKSPSNRMHPKVRLLASISLSIHHEASMANLAGKHGPRGDNGDSESLNSRSLEKGSSVALGWPSTPGCRSGYPSEMKHL